MIRTQELPTEIRTFEFEGGQQVRFRYLPGVSNDNLRQFDHRTAVIIAVDQHRPTAPYLIHISGCHDPNSANCDDCYRATADELQTP